MHMRIDQPRHDNMVATIDHRQVTKILGGFIYRQAIKNPASADDQRMIGVYSILCVNREHPSCINTIFGDSLIIGVGFGHRNSLKLLQFLLVAL